MDVDQERIELKRARDGRSESSISTTEKERITSPAKFQRRIGFNQSSIQFQSREDIILDTQQSLNDDESEKDSLSNFTTTDEDDDAEEDDPQL